MLAFDTEALYPWHAARVNVLGICPPVPHSLSTRDLRHLLFGVLPSFSWHKSSLLVDLSFVGTTRNRNRVAQY